MKYIIKGTIPSLKNNKKISSYKGRTYLRTPDEYKKWHRDASYQLVPRVCVPGKVEIFFDFWFPNNRVCDLDNKVSSLLDLLVDNKIIDDDKWSVVCAIHAQSHGVEKENARCEITINSKL